MLDSSLQTNCGLFAAEDVADFCNAEKVSQVQKVGDRSEERRFICRGLWLMKRLVLSRKE